MFSLNIHELCDLVEFGQSLWSPFCHLLKEGLKRFLKVFEEAKTFQVFPQMLIQEAFTRATLPLGVLCVQFQGKIKQTNRVKNNTATAENNLAVPQKVKHRITCQFYS